MDKGLRGFINLLINDIDKDVGDKILTSELLANTIVKSLLYIELYNSLHEKHREKMSSEEIFKKIKMVVEL